MALTLPAKLSEIKDSGSVFFIELYKFQLQNGDLYVTACDQNITFDGQEYLAVPIQHEKFSASSDMVVDACTLTIANVDDSFTAALYSGYDFRGRNVWVYQIPYPDALTNPTLVKYVGWGYLDNPAVKDGTFTIDICSQIPNLENARTLGLSCNAQYADQESCFASLDIQNGTVQTGTTTSSIVIQQSRTDNYWINGIITCGYESRQVESSTGNVIKVRYPFSIIPTTYRIQTGCDMTWQSCGLHDQQQNYSGFLAIPQLEVIREY